MLKAKLVSLVVKIFYTVLFCITALILYTYIVAQFIAESHEKYEIDPTMVLNLNKEGSIDWISSMRSNKLIPGYFYVFSHGVGEPGSPITHVLDNRSTSSISLDSRALALLIKNEMTTRQISTKTPVFIMSCNAGTGLKSFASRVSEHLLNTEIYATDEWLAISTYGITRTNETIWWTYFDLTRFSFRAFVNGNEFDAQQHILFRE